MSIEIRVGSKVVCISGRGEWFFGRERRTGPVVNEIYTISGVYHSKSSSDLGYHFEEFPDTEPDGTPRAFSYLYFRPVRTTNIDIFTKIAANPKLPIVADKFDKERIEA